MRVKSNQLWIEVNIRSLTLSSINFALVQIIYSKQLKIISLLKNWKRSRGVKTISWLVR